MLQVIQIYISRHQISWYPNMWAQVWQILWHKGFNKISLRRTSSEKLVRRAWFRMIGLPMCWSRRWIEVSDFKEYYKYTSWDIVFKKYPYQVDSMANMNGMLICYGWINIPLVYTQVSHKPRMDYLFVDSTSADYDNMKSTGTFFLISLNQSLFSGSHIGCLCLLCCLSLWSTIPLTNPVQSGGERLRPGKISSEEGNTLFFLIKIISRWRNSQLLQIGLAPWLQAQTISLDMTTMWE